MNSRYCKACGDWHNLDEPWPIACRKPQINRRSHLPAPGLIIDTMQPVQSMLDGKLYDSKSALRRTYKQAGVVEVGNDSSIIDPKPLKKSKPDRKAIRASVEKAFSRVGLGA